MSCHTAVYAVALKPFIGTYPASGASDWDKSNISLEIKNLLTDLILNFTYVFLYLMMKQPENLLEVSNCSVRFVAGTFSHMYTLL